MNTHTKSRISRTLVVLLSVLIGCLVLSGCSAEKDDSGEMIQSGADFLFALAGASFEAGWDGRHEGYFGGGAEWADEHIARIDDDRFPDWAADEYEMCVYWESSLSYDAMNRKRQPGEPSRYTFEGKSWGWILMKEEGVHVLELGIEFDGQSHLFVDQWISQP